MNDELKYHWSSRCCKKGAGATVAPEPNTDDVDLNCRLCGDAIYDFVTGKWNVVLLDYDEVCRSATALQGLDGIVRHLKLVGYKVEVDQTGGFCMVVRIDNECNDGYYGITNEGSDDDPLFQVYFYEDDEDNEGRSLAEDGRTRTTYDLCCEPQVSERLLAEYLPPWTADAIKTRDDVKAFFRGLALAGVNFHPDERAEGYAPELHPAYDALVSRCFEVAEDDGFDVYEVASDVLQVALGVRS